MPYICLLQHVLEALHMEVGLPQVLQELLGVKVGPLQRVFTSVDFLTKLNITHRVFE